MNNNKGTTKTCLADFFQSFGRIESLWEFAGVNSSTESRWRLHHEMPVGEILLRVQHFLSLVGYEVEELASQPVEVYKVGQCIAYRIVDVKTVNDEVGLSFAHTFDYFHRGITPQQTRLTALKQIADKYGAERISFEGRWRLKLSKLTSVLVAKKHDMESPAAPAADNNTDLIERFRQSCLDIQDLGGRLLDGPVQDRVTMRNRMGQSTDPVLHRTWEVLNRLLSERSTQNQSRKD